MNDSNMLLLGMTGLLKDPVIRKMVAAQLLTNKTKKDDLAGIALMAKQPEYTNNVFNRSI